MNSKEMFALFLRVVGVFGLILVVRHALSFGPAFTVSGYLIVKWVIGVLLSLYLMRGAPLVVNFAFPDKSGK
jgi:hypothetical protein